MSATLRIHHVRKITNTRGIPGELTAYLNADRTIWIGWDPRDGSHATSTTLELNPTQGRELRDYLTGILPAQPDDTTPDATP